jgi:metal-sulfur cluster biosynthetic enzyme
VKLSNSDIYDVLSAIDHPEIQGSNLLELGMIPDVEILNDHVKVILALPSLDVPIKNDLMEKIQQAI